MTGKKTQQKQSGSVLILLAVMIFLLLGFIAAGVEAGRWYLVRAELAKSVDAGALAAARNLSNPNVSPTALAVEYAQANFPAGSVGTPGAGAGSAAFTATMLAPTRVEVDGAASANSIFAQILGFGLVPVKSLSVAMARQVEIMLVLDRSGSMAGTPMTKLKEASHGFVEYFKSTQAQDKIGMISFHTNAEDAIDQADGPGGFTPQGGVAPADRIAQFLVFFSDGRPNSFRYNFVNAGKTIDGIVTQESNCDPGAIGTNVRNWMTSPTGATLVSPTPTGDGKSVASACGNTNSTRWLITCTACLFGVSSPAG